MFHRYDLLMKYFIYNLLRKHLIYKFIQEMVHKYNLYGKCFIDII